MEGVHHLCASVRQPVTLALGLGIADADEQSVGPAFVLRGIAQTMDIPPDIEECLLGGILREMAVPQDAESHAIQARMTGDQHGLQRPLVTVPCPYDEVVIHTHLFMRTGLVAGL
jgi:hypothetical protein